ncbi:iron-sulfur cluster insertion protein ErpA [Dongia soli]|uniref:Iron-sulfur cluster insertion protein ErpA n=2 Tax=Dongia soli TaxID=600628 RepID=A0ABU5EG43_9PROT|nr:iron-sulfur cluster insertion protein ErpA [Dongia soli]MDY0885090.1 iron-sulfur cluster insertion protein ErpA [Dongia soli]
MTPAIENSAQTAPMPRQVNITESAVKRIAWLMEQEGDADLMLRLSVSGGGCSGFQYGFSFDKSQQQDDHLFERDGVKVVVDDTSLDLLAGAEIDFVEDLVGAAFQVRNPNAVSSCGCGSSFSIG